MTRMVVSPSLAIGPAWHFPIQVPARCTKLLGMTGNVEIAREAFARRNWGEAHRLLAAAEHLECR